MASAPFFTPARPFTFNQDCVIVSKYFILLPLRVHGRLQVAEVTRELLREVKEDELE